MYKLGPKAQPPTPMRETVGYLIFAVLLAIILFFPSRSHACDCTFYAIEALGKVGIKLKTVPSIVVNDLHRFPGVYSEGVVTVHEVSDCRVLTHEFYHHYQATNGIPMDSRAERDAAIVTMFATEMRGDCK